MPPYRRPHVTGATVFFTVALADRRSDLLVREVAVLRDAVAEVRRGRPFGIAAWVVLPDHLHAVWTLPDGDADFSTRWGAIKARFTMALRKAEPGATPEPDDRPGFSPGAPALPTEYPVVASGRYAGLKPGLRAAKREAAIWQQRFWEHHIRDEADFAAHVRYCWGNPVKHGLVERAVDWPYSSIHRDVRMGKVDLEWSGTMPNLATGE